MKNKDLVSFDGLKLKGYLFDEVSRPKGVIQIIHGMQEHSMRYFDVISAFNNNGYIVYISDLRGHGKTAKSVDALGQDDGDIFLNTVNDQILISQMLIKKYPKLPLIIFGHSYGSFISQKYIQMCNLSKKVVICGTTIGSDIQFKLGRIVAWFTEKKNGKHGSATMIENMSLKSYAKGFDNGNWLTRDEKVWNEYKQDKFCGTPFPVSFYRSLFDNMVKLNKGIKNIAYDTKIFLIAGGSDPVGNKGKNVKKLHKKYTNSFLNAKIKIYPEARHELLNETNKEEVLKDIVNFLNEL